MTYARSVVKSPRPVLNQRLRSICRGQGQLWLDGWKGIVMRYLAGGVRRLIGIGLAGTAMVAAASLIPALQVVPQPGQGASRVQLGYRVEAGREVLSRGAAPPSRSC